MGTVRDRHRRLRAPGLRGRTALAMVAAVVVACAALTITTTQWAATQHREAQERALIDAVSRDMAGLFAALEVNPAARTLPELADAGWNSGNSGDGSSSGEGILIPLENQSAGVDPQHALQWLFVGFATPLSEREPACLRPNQWPQGSFTGGSGQQWTQPCGPYLMAYAFAQPGTGTTLGKPWLVVRALYLPTEDDPVPGLRNTLLLWSAGIIAVSALLARLVAIGVTRPMTQAGAMADAVAAGDLSVRLPAQGTDDVAAMSRAVNTMADRLTGQIADLTRANEAQRRFVSDVAHELRTPTTALLASAEALGDPATRDRAAALVAPQLRRLAGLTEDLLEISRMDAGRAEVVTSQVDVVDLIAEVVSELDGSIEITGPAELPLTTDPVRVRAVVRNLVANAIQHGSPPVTVSLIRDGSTVTLDVHDSGSGVPDGLRERVFDRFVRGDEARHGSSSGLGLAIAAENAHLLGGSLGIQPDGSTFRLTLPVQDDATAAKP